MVCVIVETHGERYDTIAGERRYVADDSRHSFPAYADNSFRTDTYAVAVRVGQFAVDLEVAQVGNDGDFFTFGDFLWPIWSLMNVSVARRGARIWASLSVRLISPRFFQQC